MLQLLPRTVLERLGEVRCSDYIGASEVSDGSRQLEDAVEGTGREVQLIHRRLEQALGGWLYLAELAHLQRGHIRVAHEPGTLETPLLYSPRFLNPLPHRLRALTQPVISELLVVDAGNLNEDIYTVEQWPADTLLVP